MAAPPSYDKGEKIGEGTYGRDAHALQTDGFPHSCHEGVGFKG